MAELTLAYQARSYSTGIVGRSICNARNQHWVAENSGGEAVGAGELFCASIAALLGGIEVNVAAYRDFDKPTENVSLYDAVRIEFEMWGVSDDDARFLVKTWKQR